MRTKQFFIIQMMVAAAFLCSCSSDDNFTADSMGTDSQMVADMPPMPILLGVSPNSIEVTRGTGTVGDIEGEAANVWNGERINVLMLNQGTMTPAQLKGADICVDDTFACSASGVATPVDGIQRYFPARGCSDFWAYRLDDAAILNPVDFSTTAWTIGFQIDGSQDIMVAKAVPTEAQMNLLPGKDQSWCYSSYAAHQGVNPNFTFRHLLTRLTFSVTPVTDEAATEVTIEKLTVATYTQGTLTIAATGDVAGEKQAIEWNTTIPRDTVLLKQRVSAGAPLVECSSVPPTSLSLNTPHSLGEALLVAPDTAYTVRVYFTQNDEHHYSEYTVKLSEGSPFQAGNSYHIQLELSGYTAPAPARASLEPWIDVVE